MFCQNFSYQFVKNVNRRISKSFASDDESVSEEDNDLYESYNSESLKFFHDFSDDNGAKIEPDKTFDSQDKLPEIFGDGNFELVDGLIVLIKTPSRKKIDFKGKLLPRRKSQSDTNKEFRPRAA